MFKFATNRLTRKQPNEENESRRRLQKDLFAFSKIADKGFPSKPSAMDYDKKLRLLAIGTKNGDIRIYGAPGVQLSCYQDVPFPIQRLLFVQGAGQLISLVVRNEGVGKGECTYHLILWQVNQQQQQKANQGAASVEKVKEYQIEQKLGRISAMSLLNENTYLFIGFESGDIYVFNVAKFEIVPGVINREFIMKKLPDNLKKNPGSVESIQHHPRNLTKLLIGYQRGLFVIFDFNKNTIDQIRTTTQPLESACFYQSGECAATSHSDGSLLLWDLSDTHSTPATNSVYGPYPCRPISKVLVKTVKNQEPIIIFSGGVPRASYSDKISISIIQENRNHVTLDFTSKIIEFFTVDKPNALTSGTNSASGFNDNPQALFVLLEEEFVAIDLVSDNWPQYKLPYLYSVHSSAVICTHYCNSVSASFYAKLVAIGNGAHLDDYSDREWPIGTGTASTGSPPLDETQSRDLLLTGHEDGSVRFWDVTHMCMQLVYRLNTAEYFQTESAPPEDPDEENWPPFRKVGTFDPYSDDPKLGIQKILMCATREILVVAGTAGQVLLMSMSEKGASECQLAQFKINIVTDVDSFVWKGHEPLAVRDSVSLVPGYQPLALIQLYPPATVSALCLNTDWRLISMGTSHGFALFDYLQMKQLLVRCTLDPMLLNADAQAAAANGAGAISRRKSLKKSLRESFRKLRRGRSQKTQKVGKDAAEKQVKNDVMRVEALDDMDHRPVERQVESREFKPMDDIPPSVIRYIYFVRTYITNNTTLTNSLWVGTNTGVIYIYTLHIPDRNNRLTSQVHCTLAKEMRLKHRAPVVHIQVIDQSNSPLPSEPPTRPIGDTLSGHTSPQAAHHHHHNEPLHKVIICSEEQFKVFQLPTLKPYCKFKLTAMEGARVRRIAYNKYTSKSDPSYSEHCLSCLTNLGDLSVYSLPNLKRQVQTQCMKQQDINAITSFVFSKFGQAFYLQSPSEFLHISMSAYDTMHAIEDPKAAKNGLNPVKKTQSQSSKSQSLTHTPKDASGSALKAATLTPVASNNMSSPTSPPPPVPAPRTLSTSSSRCASANLSPVTAAGDQPNVKKAILNAKKMKEDASVVREEDACRYDESGKKELNDDSGIVKEPMLSELEHLSLRSKFANMTTSSLKTVSNHLNESSFNTTDLSLINGHTASSHGAASTSGISSLYTTSDLSGVDLSMDSVVDKFSEEYNDISAKIKPINEEISSSPYSNNVSSCSANNTSLLNGVHAKEESCNSSTITTTSSSKVTKSDDAKTNGNDHDDFDPFDDENEVEVLVQNGHIMCRSEEESMSMSLPKKYETSVMKPIAAKRNTMGAKADGSNTKVPTNCFC